MTRSANPALSDDDSKGPHDGGARRKALLDALCARIAEARARELIEQALERAGLPDVPSNVNEAETFVRSALLPLASSWVGEAVVAHWEAELVQAVRSAVSESAPRTRHFDVPPTQTHGLLTDTEIDPWLGRVLDDNFRLIQRAAKGSRGVLYRAERVSDGSRLAVKLLAPSLHQTVSSFRNRVLREVGIAKSLAHPNTVVVYDSGEADEQTMYVAMEWLSGIHVSNMVASRGPLSPRQAMYLAHQVCRSLAHAHARGIVHGDLSPDGIFVARQIGGVSVVKVMDYGRRRLTTYNEEGHSQIGLPQGWARYLAPEQIVGDDFDQRADIYSLGAILYESLCGERPFQDSTGIGILMSQVHDRPPPLRERLGGKAVPEEIEELVMRCLEKDPERRFETVEALVERTMTLSR